PPSLIRKYFPESVVLYKPKDIVAGDFYWIAPLPLSAGEGALIAAVDCTGHGVPGAMVSVVCSNALNRAVKEFHITDPGKILDKTRELVLETFEKSEGNIQDGMDISLASLSRSNGGMTVQWAGAYNPLLYFPCSEGMWSTVEIPADKQPIGSSDNPAPFTTHTFEIPIMEGGNTCIYLFTDGFADQFGGAKGKKLKYRQMQELFLANAHKSMKEQKLILENSLKQWMGSLEQVDDILIIGIKV
ncbi:MAG: SpoIIE family protein phosphatase, partial [Bacteroidia bacterium]|nr:SpoIIE family protein phosphatase [Bacteroidia bacterium]